MLLVVWHPVPPSIHRLRDAVLAGFADAGDPLPVRSLTAPDAGPDDVDAARGLVLVTTENFGMVSGLVKDFLERIYPWFQEVPHRNPGLPYLLISKGGNDGTGAVRDIENDPNVGLGYQGKSGALGMLYCHLASTNSWTSLVHQASLRKAGLPAG